jgi:hypothetical protein
MEKINLLWSGVDTGKRARKFSRGSVQARLRQERNVSYLLKKDMGARSSDVSGIQTLVLFYETHRECEK